MDGDFQIICGDSLIELPMLASDSLDSCVTDPPYELGFMGKVWDKSGIAYSVDLWREVYRVLKPGAHLVAFGGTRTYHRMACAIEDAGFEIRDQLQWIYGQGFPKSLDVSKVIDKMAGAEREVVGVRTSAYGTDTATGERLSRKGGGAGLFVGTLPKEVPLKSPTPATDEAKQWNGWGTALKPANEPICLARKPLEKGLTVAQNVLKWGTGAINVDGCRIPTDDLLGGGAENPDTNAVMKSDGWDRPWMHDDDARIAHSARVRDNVQKAQSLGRFPANVIHDGSDEVLERFPDSTITGKRLDPMKGYHQPEGGEWFGRSNHNGDEYTDSGSAARFFYTAKASKYDRNNGLNGFPVDRPDERTETGMGTFTEKGVQPQRNHHPTVKPVDLMRWLCRLVTPPNGVIIDPFLGSGSTAKAALVERFKVIGIEIDPEYAKIADARCRELQVKLF